MRRSLLLWWVSSITVRRAEIRTNPGQLPILATLMRESRSRVADYDAYKCGIGWHGDKERKIVVGTRFGPGANGMPIKLQWFQRCQPVGHEARIELNAGDLYVFSDKAVGYDWGLQTIFTLRHAAGGEGYKPAATKQSGRPQVQVFR